MSAIVTSSFTKSVLSPSLHFNRNIPLTIFFLVYQQLSKKFLRSLVYLVREFIKTFLNDECDDALRRLRYKGSYLADRAYWF